MPQTAMKNGPQLGIRLDRPDLTYTPGETITGKVFRKNPVVTPKATIRISLHARTKSRLVVNKGHMTFTYRGRFDLVKPADNIQTIFQGPLHITADGGEQLWNFSLRLPVHNDSSALGSGLTQDQSYLSLDEGRISNHPLPPTFLTERYQTLSGLSAFVEYFLQAELSTSSRGSSRTTDATLPFKVLYPNPDPSNIGPSLCLSRHIQIISLPSLATGQTIEAATTKADAADPTLAFDIKIQMPTVLRINSPEPVPILVSAVPDMTKSSSDMQFRSHEILITHISVHIIARTEIKCPAGKATRQADIETKIDLGAEDAYCRHGSSLCVPWELSAIEEQTAQQTTRVLLGETSEPINIGELLGLRLARNKDLYPTFETYNIQHTHLLKWKMIVQVAGKSHEMDGLDAIKILTSPELERSTEWIQPPADDELPSFADYEEGLDGSDVVRRESDAAGVGGLSRLWVL